MDIVVWLMGMVSPWNQPSKKIKKIVKQSKKNNKKIGTSTQNPHYHLPYIGDGVPVFFPFSKASKLDVEERSD